MVSTFSARIPPALDCHNDLLGHPPIHLKRTRLIGKERPPPAGDTSTAAGHVQRALLTLAGTRSTQHTARPGAIRRSLDAVAGWRKSSRSLCALLSGHGVLRSAAVALTDSDVADALVGLPRIRERTSGRCTVLSRNEELPSLHHHDTPRIRYIRYWFTMI